LNENACLNPIEMNVDLDCTLGVGVGIFMHVTLYLILQFVD